MEQLIHPSQSIKKGLYNTVEMPWMQYTYVIHMYAKNAMNFRFEHFAQQSESIDHTHCVHCKVNSQIKGKILFKFSDFYRSILGF